MLEFLGRVAPGIRDVPLHPLEHGIQHLLGSHSAALDLMHRSLDVAELNLRRWTDFTTGVGSVFLVSAPAERYVSSTCMASLVMTKYVLSRLESTYLRFWY